MKKGESISCFHPPPTFGRPWRPLFLLALSLEIAVIGQHDYCGENHIEAEKDNVPSLDVHLHYSFLIGLCVVLTLERCNIDTSASR
jgi:hypothetical protein